MTHICYINISIMLSSVCMYVPSGITETVNSPIYC